MNDTHDLLHKLTAAVQELPTDHFLLRTKFEALSRQRDELRTERDQLAQRLTETTSATVPRIIGADEVQGGMQIAWKNNIGWHTIQVEESDIGPDKIFTGHTIVLLEDAPEPVQVGDEVNTAEQLEALPQGAVVIDNAQDVWQLIHHPHARLRWERMGDDDTFAPSEVAHGAPLRILHLPEPEDGSQSA